MGCLETGRQDRAVVARQPGVPEVMGELTMRTLLVFPLLFTAAVAAAALAADEGLMTPAEERELGGQRLELERERGDAAAERLDKEVDERLREEVPAPTGNITPVPPMNPPGSPDLLPPPSPVPPPRLPGDPVEPGAAP
jgi:hypothetical protein